MEGEISLLTGNWYLAKTDMALGTQLAYFESVLIGMKHKVLILILCLLFGNLYASGQSKTKSKSFPVKTISLSKIAKKYGLEGSEKTLKISNVILEDVRGFENDWPHLFQLYDPREQFRRGAKTESENPCCIQEFSIFATEQIGKPLLEQKDEWLNRRVNVYVHATDRGLTPWKNIGLVVKVELLNGKGKVEKTLSDHVNSGYRIMK